MLSGINILFTHDEMFQNMIVTKTRFIHRMRVVKRLVCDVNIKVKQERKEGEGISSSFWHKIIK